MQLGFFPKKLSCGRIAEMKALVTFGLASSLITALSSSVEAQPFDASLLLLGSGNGPVTCHVDYPDRIKPVHYPASGEIESGDEVRLHVERRFAGLGIDALNDARAREKFKSELLEWATNDALSSGNKHNAGDRHRMLLPIAVAYGHNKSSFSAEEQATVEAWLIDLVDEIAGSGEIRSLPKQHNISYLHGAVQMALGIATNNVKRVAKGVKAFKAGMKGIRKDGSFVNDSERGEMGVHYQNASLSTLITIAEMARNQGIDLYADGGKEKLAKAIDFLLAATEDPSLIQADGEVKRDWDTYENAEWVYYWLERFPETPQAAEIRNDVDYLREHRIGIYALVGGSAGCFTRR